MAECATWETRYTQAFQRGEELAKEVTEKNRTIADKDTEIFQLTSKLRDFDGKIALTKEEYEKLNDPSPLKRYSRWELFKQMLRG